MDAKKLHALFLKKVGELNIRFPVADIVKKTKYQSGTISEYMNNKKPVSQRFFKIFCDAYGFDFDEMIKADEVVIPDTPKLDELNEGQRMRRKKAIGDGTEDPGLIYVPIAAQAGYSRNFEDPVFVNQLERLYIPGLPYKGDRYRYFDVEGDSMEPTLEEGMQVIGEQVNQEDWKHINDFYIYVIVKINKVLIKRLFKKHETTFVMISDNEEYSQEPLLAEDIKELWLVKRKLDWRMTPPKRFEITV